MKIDKLKHILFNVVILACCVLTVINVVRIINGNKHSISNERIIRIPKGGLFNLPDSLNDRVDSIPFTKYKFYLYLDGKACASCWAGKLIDIQEFFRDSLPNIKPYLLFNITADLKSFEQRAFYESFGDFGFVFLDFGRSIARNNDWIMANGAMSYGIITDSENNICSCKILSDPVFLTESKRYYESK